MERKPIYLAVITIDPYQVKEYKDFISAKKVKPIAVIKQTFKGLHTTYSGNEYDIYNYRFLHEVVGDLTRPFMIGNWSIEDIYEGYWGRKRRFRDGDQVGEEWGSYNLYSISDPNGELRSKSFYGPEEAIKQLVMFSAFKNWVEYELVNPPLGNDIKEVKD